MYELITWKRACDSFGETCPCVIIHEKKIMANTRQNIQSIDPLAPRSTTSRLRFHRLVHHRHRHCHRHRHHDPDAPLFGDEWNYE